MKKIIEIILFISITAYSQMTIQGSVKYNAGKSSLPVSNALVKLFEIYGFPESKVRAVIDSAYTDVLGRFNFQISTLIDDKDTDLPDKFEIFGNYPNPFLDATKIDLYMQYAGNVTIAIYTVLGQLVAINQQYIDPGIYTIHWQGGTIPGIYFATVQLGNQKRNVKLIQLRSNSTFPELYLTNTNNSIISKRHIHHNSTSANYLQITVSKYDFLTYYSSALPYESQTVSITLDEVTEGTVTDIDGNVYKTIKIGDQWWMAENLKVVHYRNGNPIFNGLLNFEWLHFLNGAYCNYDNDESYLSSFSI